MDSEATPAPVDVPEARPEPETEARPERRLWVAFCALLAVLAVSGVVLIVDGVYRHRLPEAAPGATASPVVDRLTQLPQAVPQAYDGGSLKLVEQGFTQL